MLKLIFVSLILNSVTKGSFIPNNLECPDGWESIDSFNTNCYLIVADNKKQWSDAKEFCENLEADLFLPTNSNEETMVWDLYQNKGNVIDRLWIDAIALDPKDPLKYTRSNGKDLIYTNWLSSPKQPNNANSKAFIGISGGNPPKWIDAAGPADFDFVCEKDISTFTNQSCFQENVLFVENSVDSENIEQCRNLCKEIKSCEVNIFKYVMSIVYSLMKDFFF